MKELTLTLLLAIIIVGGALGLIALGRIAFQREPLTIIEEYQKCLNQTQNDQEYCYEVTK